MKKKQDSKFIYTFCILTLVTFLYHVMNIAFSWSKLPDEIPIHFSNGQADNWGSKYFLLVLPIIGIITWVALNYFVRNPSKLNYSNLTKENQDVQFQKGKNVMSLIQNASTMVFLLGNDTLIKKALGEGGGIQFTITIGLLLLCLIAPFSLAFNLSKKK